MQQSLKKLILTAIAGLVTLVVIALILPFFLHSDSLKTPVLRKLEAATGYFIAAEGDISIRLLPSARLRIGDVSLRNTSNNEPFVRVHTLDVGVELLPLVRGDIALTRVAFNKPQIHLIQSADKNNWEAQPPKIPKPALRPSQRLEPMNADKPAPSGHRVLVQHVEIKEGALTYQDVAKATQMKLASLNLQAGMSDFDAPFMMKAGFTWNDNPAKLKMELGSFAKLMNNNQTPFRLSLESDNVSLQADGQLDRMQYTGKIALKSPNLSQALAWIAGSKIKQGQPLAFDIAGAMECSPLLCGVKNGSLHVNDILLTGSVQSKMVGNKPEIAAELNTKLLDITPFMPKQTASLGLISSAFAEAARWSGAPIDLSGLRAVNGYVSLKAERLVAGKFTVDTPFLRAKFASGTLSADMLDAKLYGGTGMVDVSMSADGRLQGRASANGVEIEPLLVALSGSDRFSGKGTIQLSFASQGKSPHALVSNLEGGGNIQLLDGSVKGVDIAGMIRNVKAAFTRGETGTRKTDFAELGGTFSINNGIITNNDLAMKAPLLRVNGKGTIDLPDYSLNYLLTPQIVDTAKGQGGKEKEGLGVPIRITGSLDNPSYAPDLGAAVEDVLKDPAKIKDAVKGAKELLKDKNSIKDLKGLLKGL